MARKTGWMLLTTMLLASPGSTAETPASPTFAALLRRVVRRDVRAAETIETVRARNDAPDPEDVLSLEMRRTEDGKAVDVIALNYGKDGSTLLERYLLKLEPRVESELRKYERGRDLRYLRATEVKRVKRDGKTVLLVPQAARLGPTPPPLPIRSDSAGKPLYLTDEAKAKAAAASLSPSPTMVSILQRVTERDPDTGAIVAVKSLPDSPLPGVSLRFSLDFQQDQAIVTLVRSRKGQNVVYELYRLRMSPEIDAEADKLRRLKKRQQDVEAQRQQILRLSNGKLHYEMKVEEVERILGPGRREAGGQALGLVSLSYPEFTLHFQGFQLTRIEKASDP